jgi:hypothetical protein
MQAWLPEQQEEALLSKRKTLRAPLVSLAGQAVAPWPQADVVPEA